MRLIELGGLRVILILLMVSVFLIGCKESRQSVCPITDAVLIKPPEDSAVSGTPEEGYYYVNQNRTIWAGAWWVDQDGEFLRVGKEIKVGWSELKFVVWAEPWKGDLHFSKSKTSTDECRLTRLSPRGELRAYAQVSSV